MHTLASRILPGNKAVRGHVSSENMENNRKAFDFFCKSLKKESSADAEEDTKAEFGIPIRVESSNNKFRDEPIHIYDVYIG